MSMGEGGNATPLGACILSMLVVTALVPSCRLGDSLSDFTSGQKPDATASGGTAGSEAGAGGIGGVGGSAGSGGGGGFGGAGGTGGESGSGGMGGTGGLGGFGGLGGSGGSGGSGGTSDGGTGGSGGTADPCSIVLFPSSCDQCLKTNCMVECIAADSDPNWESYNTCLASCQDEACRDACEDDYPATHARSILLNACLDDLCGHVCNTGCGLSTGDPVCDDCFHTACNGECTALTIDPDIIAFIECVQNCSDEACYNACFSNYPATATLYEALVMCIQSKCPGACGAY